jgi:hypothetical protein
MVAFKAAADIGGGNPPGWIIFERCKFFALSTGVNVAATAPTTGKIVLSNCTSAGVSAWSASSTNVIVTNGFTADDDAGLGVVVD